MHFPARAFGVAMPLALGLLLSPGPRAALARDLPTLAIRVDFQPDTLETTTGDGSFESAFQFDEAWAIDPLPHDKAYFEDQLLFLRNYYHRVSRGELEIQAEVWPPAAQAAYRLPKKMWQYNWNKDRETTNAQLIQLFRDCWAAADADPALDFSRFEAFIVFHAGVGQDFGEDSTPHDIPSAWISPFDLEGEALLVDDFDGGVQTEITNGLLLPESENHEGFQQGLAGTMVLQFAHVLNLPNLYNGEDGSSVIGKWGLMDQGSANFFGLLPAMPSAWSRLQMGWDEAVVLDRDTTGVRIAPLGHENGQPRIYKVPMGPHEYLLLEYRRRTLAGDTLVVASDRQGREAWLDRNYEVSFPGDTTGVLVEAENFDFDLPGSGLLIWHVDERRTTPDYVTRNAVNDLPDPLGGYEFIGVDLEEGDGVQDIGQPYTLLDSRRPVRLGGSQDPWYFRNNEFLRINTHLDTVAFSSESVPDSRRNDGVYSGVRISGLSPRGSEDEPRHLDSLYFDLSFDFRHAADGLPMLPPGEEARLQAFSWSPGLALLAARHEDGRLYGRWLGEHAPEAAIRGDGFPTPLPLAQSDSLRGLWLQTDPDTMLWAHRGSRLQGFGLQEGGLVLAAERQPAPIDSVLFFQAGGRAVIQSGGVTWSYDLVSGDLSELAPAGAAVQVTSSRFDGESLALIVDDVYRGLNLNPNSHLVGMGEEGRVLIRDDHGYRVFRGDMLESRVELNIEGAWPIQAGEDEALEVLVLAYDGSLRVYNDNGAEIARSPARFTRVEAVYSGSWLGNDGEALCLLMDNAVWKLDPDGGMRELWPRGLPDLGTELVCLPDAGLSQDGSAGGLFLAVDSEGLLVARSGAPEGLVWTHPRGTANGEAVASGSGLFSTELRREQEQNPVYVWPNPAEGEANLRVWMEAPGEVRMRVYDMAGDLRMSLEERVEDPGYNDLRWSTAPLSNGGYFCAVEVLPDNGSAKTTTLKLAVLR